MWAMPTLQATNLLNDIMAFDIDKLFKFCTEEINNFGEKHQNESFYGFAIDASLLCLNSEEEFSVSLKRYQDEWDYDNRSILTWDELTERDIWLSESSIRVDGEYLGSKPEDRNAHLIIINQDRAEERAKGNPYRKNDEILSLRENTGDWQYQGFVKMTESVGFDEDAYDLHYNLSDDEQKTSAYGKAMDELLRRLTKANVFAFLRLSPSFYAIRVEHSY